MRKSIISAFVLGSLVLSASSLLAADNTTTAPAAATPIKVAAVHKGHKHAHKASSKATIAPIAAPAKSGN